MKTSKLLISSLLAAAMSVPAYGVTTTTTTLDDVTYSGTIWTTNVSGVSTGTNLSSTSRTYTSGDLRYTGGETVSGSTKFWAYFFSGSENTSLGNTLRLTGATADHTVRTDYSDYVWLGGLITDTSDYTYTIGRAYSDGNGSFFHLKGAASSGVNMKIGSNTTIWGDRGISVDSSGSWVIDAGKTLSLKSVVSTAANVPSTNGVATFAAGTTTTVSGGGTLSFTECANLILNGNLSIGESTALDLSGANVTLASAIQNSGTVTLSGTTVFALDNLTATNGTYSLITGNSVTDVSGVSFTRDGSVINSSRVSVSTTSGYAVTVTNYSDLVWAGTAENSAWNTTAENWSSTAAGGSVAFENRDSVTFGADAGVFKTVSVASVVVANSVAVSDSYEFAFSNNGSVTASTMSIADGKTLTLSGTGLLTTGAVSGGGNLTVGAGTEATFTAANTLSGSMTLDGTLNLNNSVLSVSENTATISALSSLTGFSGSGRLVLDITRKDEAKNVDFSPVSGFTGTLVVKGSSRMNLLGETDSLNAINQFAGIEVQSGAQLYLSSWTGQGNRVSNLSRTLTIAGAGYGSNANQAALRMSDNATLSGQLILSGNATVHSATGTQTISGGISAAGKTLTINGADILNISGTADITIGTLTLNKSGDTNLSATGTTTIGTLNVATGTLNISGATLSGATALNFTAASGSVNFKKADGADSATYDIGAISFNNSDNTGRNMTIDEGVTVNAASLSAAYAFGTVTVNGALNLNGAISVKPGSTANANTITGSGSVSTTGVTIGNVLSVCTISVREISIGSGGITAENSKTLTLGGDTTVKAAAAWTSSATLALLSGTAGTTFDTNGNDLVLNGGISGAGKLVKTGAGTLTLNGDNTFSGGIEIAAGVVEATNAAALGAAANAVRISGGKLKIGNGDTAVRLAQTNIEIVLGAAYAKTDSAADATKAAILGSSTTAKSSLASGAVTITVEAADAVALAAATEQTQKMYQIFDLSTISLDGTTVTFKLGESLKNQGYTGYDFDANTGTLILTVPETSAFGLLAGAGALALVAARRRRTKKA